MNESTLVHHDISIVSIDELLALIPTESVPGDSGIQFNYRLPVTVQSLTDPVMEDVSTYQRRAAFPRAATQQNDVLELLSFAHYPLDQERAIELTSASDQLVLEDLAVGALTDFGLPTHAVKLKSHDGQIVTHLLVNLEELKRKTSPSGLTCIISGVPAYAVDIFAQDLLDQYKAEFEKVFKQHLVDKGLESKEILE